MPLFRNEFNKTIIRLRLMRDELQDKGFSKTAETLSEAISLLDKTDNVYITELAAKKIPPQSKEK